jgi:hypothetical protein
MADFGIKTSSVGSTCSRFIVLGNCFLILRADSQPRWGTAVIVSPAGQYRESSLKPFLSVHLSTVASQPHKSTTSATRGEAEVRANLGFYNDMKS